MTKKGFRFTGWTPAVLALLAVGCAMQMGCTTQGNGQKSQSSETGGVSPVAGLYEYHDDVRSRWSSPENKNGRKGMGGMENQGAKGHPYSSIEPHQTLSLLDIQEQGVISRIWITINDRSPQMLRALKLEMFWDGADKPAVSAPLGDFFGVGLGLTAPFHNALFANPEGRSFLCFVPMPFRKGARIQITNESDKRLSSVFFDVDYQLTTHWDEDNLYFHACWRRDTATVPGKDFELLPEVAGRGRFLGVNIGVNANPRYNKLWWGEGEVKIWLDGDKEFPTLTGTGTEDYIGTGWSQGKFATDYSGCLIADWDNLQWAFYRFHIPDPVFFHSGCKVALQQIGGGPPKEVAELQRRNTLLIPTSTDGPKGYQHLFVKDGKPARVDSSATGWTNFYRSDDVSATAYFYLDRPADELEPLQPAAIRGYNLKGVPAAGK
ncbi:MAG: DUF2961 domain-containing protein [Puia sp.]|nr:DUF2961 domain-containing protein [Puia sp.]